MNTSKFIDVARLPIGTTILVETDLDVMEMQVAQLDPIDVFITSTDPRLKQPTLGRLLHSIPGGPVQQPIKVCPGQIVEGMRIIFQFHNGTYESSIVRSASVSGTDWHYDVFGRNP